MDREQLRLEEALKELEGLVSGSSKPKTSNYSAPEKVKKESQDPQLQRMQHRGWLLWLVVMLSTASFLFLVMIIAFQMYRRINHPGYTGVSDTVINIVAVSVFAQVIAVVATIAKIIFKD